MLLNVCEFLLQWRFLPGLLTGFGVPVAVRVPLLKVPNVYRLSRFVGAQQKPVHRLKLVTG